MAPKGEPDAPEACELLKCTMDLIYGISFFSGDIFNNRPPFHFSRLLEAGDKRVHFIMQCGYALR